MLFHRKNMNKIKISELTWHHSREMKSCWLSSSLDEISSPDYHNNIHKKSQLFPTHLSLILFIILTALFISSCLFSESMSVPGRKKWKMLYLLLPVLSRLWLSSQQTIWPVLSRLSASHSSLQLLEVQPQSQLHPPVPAPPVLHLGLCHWAPGRAWTTAE